MQLYADRPVRRARQVGGDLLVAGTGMLALWLALRLRDAILVLDGAAERMQDSGRTVRSGAAAAVDVVEGVPGVGGALARPFATLARAGGELATAGTETSETVHTLATLVPALLVGLVVGYLLFRLLPARIRWAREVAAVRRLLDGDDAAQLLALRTVANRPLRVLRQEIDDPAGALAAQRWTELAGVELRALGLDDDRLPG